MNDMSRQATRLDAIGGRYDPWLLGAAATLASLGVVMVASSSIELSENPFYYLTRHLLFLGIGVGLAFWIISVVLVLIGLATLKVR